MQEMKPAKIIDTVDMISMGMGEEGGIDPLDALAQCLEAQIRRGIYQDVPPVVVYEQ
jgi:hypothetical protein